MCLCILVVIVGFTRCSLCICVCVDILFFFFFKQKTAYEMRISDWSSDVCSSDLAGAFTLHPDEAEVGARRAVVEVAAVQQQDSAAGSRQTEAHGRADHSGSYDDDVGVLQGGWFPM